MLTRLEGAPIGASLPLADMLANLPFDQQGLVAAIAQQFDTQEVLMLAWMNRAAIEETLATSFACYCSRSRQTLWRKGETSGCRQRVVEARFDCDGDAILLLVDQLGGACHTGRRSCFYNAVKDDRVEVISTPLQLPIDQNKE
ncbi:MAG: phosphoribosyl-AMP cyclohydrolase [Azonexus sp.]|nr:phosphoribosyl-AMP cyclohydrolase [Azonexus sp.]